MAPELELLIFSAAGIGFLHTIAGPDHYLPFIALSKSKGWSFAKTLSWTIICGCGHVWSSVLLGLGGAALGWSLSKVSWLERVRGGIAGWIMLLFGLVYGIYGLVRARGNYRHKHFDSVEDGSLYVYEHKHGRSGNFKGRYKVTPWVMFIIFLLGPCEPMIPLLYFPAAQNSWHAMMVLIIVYTIVTLTSMAGMVTMGYYGLAFLQTNKLERYMHAIGGLTLVMCAAGMLFMGW